MRLSTAVIVVVTSLFCRSVLAEPAKETPLTPIRAREHVGKMVLVQMDVRAAKDRLEKHGEVYLDSEPDFRSKQNFAVVITRRGANSLAEKQLRDLAEHYQGKRIIVRGMVKEVNGVPRIEVDEAKQIRVVAKP